MLVRQSHLVNQTSYSFEIDPPERVVDFGEEIVCVAMCMLFYMDAH